MCLLDGIVDAIQNCMSRLEVVDALLQDLRQREITSLSQNNALIEVTRPSTLTLPSLD